MRFFSNIIWSGGRVWGFSTKPWLIRVDSYLFFYFYFFFLFFVSFFFVAAIFIDFISQNITTSTYCFFHHFQHYAWCYYSWQNYHVSLYMLWVEIICFTFIILECAVPTARKVSKFGTFSVSEFSVFGLNTEITE